MPYIYIPLRTPNERTVWIQHLYPSCPYVSVQCGRYYGIYVCHSYDFRVTYTLWPKIWWPFGLNIYVLTVTIFRVRVVVPIVRGKLVYMACSISWHSWLDHFAVVKGLRYPPKGWDTLSARVRLVRFCSGARSGVWRLKMRILVMPPFL